MKFILGLIICSSVYQTCLEPYEWPDKFNSHYECMIFGYEESIRKAKEIAEETGKDYDEVLNELYQTEIRRKSKSEEDIARDKQDLKIQDIIDVTSTRSGPTLTTNQANLIYNDEIQLSKANPEAYNSFLRTSSRDKYVYKNDEYEGDINSEAGATLKDNSILGSLPENTYVYDITTGNFIYRQGKRVLKLDLDIQEG